MKKLMLGLVLAVLAGGCELLLSCGSTDEIVARGVTVNDAVAAKTETRVFSDGFAVRYVLPAGKRRIKREDTQWILPEDATAYFQKGNNYEASFTVMRVKDIAVGQRISMPLTAKLPDGTYRMLTEANVVDYTDGGFVYLGGGRFAIDYYADRDGFDQDGSDTTPWRVMITAPDLQTLATSDILRRLCPEPSPEVALAAARIRRPGRCIWQWLPANSPKYPEQKDWYDRTAALGYEYYLIDDGWRTWRDGDLDQWACLKKVIDYGKSVGVQSFMWVDSKEMRDAASRKAYLDKVAASGAVGIKIDFVPAPSFKWMRWYEETLADTLAHGLMTDFHGCVKPSGREKTWPHEIAREAIRGHEWHITRYKRVLPPEHDCILPFHRLVQGHADYTPVVFEPSQLIHFTWPRELAQGIVFAAPFLCFGDFPKNYQENPAVEMIKALPAVYDETRILPGSEIGACVAVAKRKGNVWFVGVENGAAARSLKIDFSFLGSSARMLAFSDVPNRLDACRKTDETVTSSDGVKLDLAPGGGWAAMFTPVK